MSQWYWQSLVPQRWKKNLISKLKRVVYRELIHREISNKNNNEICDIKNIISVLVEKQLHVSFYSVFFVITTLIPSLVYFILKSNLSNCTKGFRGQTLPHTLHWLAILNISRTLWRWRFIPHHSITFLPKILVRRNK